ncbi:hypothetical protein SAMN05444392_10183 [Seinonella peptonophila]|uniref:Uncharacterized protein n=1 Tax=Seinonella peptonophila TaxID=112248 RepID=A0A1M4SQ58_9BACL|nr:hypothetical protein [Seinonella peptonophila]SHE34312.1 hypothetical protein SAMN05444392_10183 [Seinonella peptonophila]
MSKITERNTKATILKALRDAEKKITELEKGKLDAVAVSNIKKEVETTSKANEIISEDIDEKIADLSKSVAQLLTKIGEDTVEQAKNLKTVTEAITIKEAELQELYGIEKQAHTLAGLVNAHQTLKLEQEQELTEAKEKATNELEEIRKAIQLAREEHEVLLKEQQAELKQLKSRQEEEFQYDFARHQKQSYDELNDELAEKRKIFENEFEKKRYEQKDIEKQLQERESDLSKREEKMEELEAEVASLPDKIASIKEEAENKAKEKFKRQMAIKEGAMKKEIEADKRILETERDNLKNQLTAAHESMAELQAKLDEAYKRIQEMGIQMVSGSKANEAIDKIAHLVSEKNSK